MRQEKDIKDIQIRKEEAKLSVFADGMILHIKTSKTPPKKLLEQVNKFSEVPQSKINIWNSSKFLIHHSKLSEREIKKVIFFTTTAKKKGKILSKEMKYLYNENYKTLMKDKTEKGLPYIHELKESILSMLPKVTYSFSVVPIKHQRKVSGISTGQELFCSAVSYL